MLNPRIFVSAVTRELKTARQIVARTLTAIGHEPVWQEIFDTGAGDLRKLLRDKIDSCQAVVQLVGDAYGMEPPVVDDTFGRVSYTQYEALYALSKNKPVYYILADKSFPIDADAMAIDGPRTQDPGEIDAASQRRQLQADYRSSILNEGAIRYSVANESEIKNTIYEMRRELDRLRSRTRLFMSAVLTALIAIAGGLTWMQFRTPAETRQAIQNATPQIAQAVETKLDDPELLRARLRMSVNQQFEKKTAELSVLDADKYQAALQLLKKGRQDTFEQIDALIESIQAGIAARNAPSELAELTRLLQEDPNAAIDYVKRHAPSILNRIDARSHELATQNQADLNLLLDGIQIAIVEGDLEFAVSQIDEVLKRDPEMARAYHERARARLALGNRSASELNLWTALDHYEQAKAAATRAHELSPDQVSYEQAMLRASLRMGDMRLDFADPRGASREYKDAHGIAYRLVDDTPANVEFLLDLAEALEGLGKASQADGEFDDAKSRFGDTLEIYRGLYDKEPKNPERRRLLSRAYLNLGDVNPAFDPAEAIAMITQGLKLFEESGDSSVEDLFGQAQLYGSLSDIHSDRGNVEQAMTAGLRSLTLYQRLAADVPDSRRGQYGLSLAIYKVGTIELDQMRYSDARQNFAKAVEIQQKITAPSAGNFDSWLALTLSQACVAETYRLSDDPRAAIVEYEKALETLDGIVKKGVLGERIQGAPPKAIIETTHLFRIPFSANPEELQNLEATEIRLYVSVDHGNSWTLASTVDLHATKFQFRAPGDGEYRFCVRTLDRYGKLHPESLRNEMTVVLDAAAKYLRQLSRIRDGIQDRIAECRRQIEFQARRPADATQPENGP